MKSVFELSLTEKTGGNLVAAIKIDGVPFGDSCIDLVDLKNSAIISGAYDIQTCGCGTPQCAGFWEPIFVQHEEDIVRWEFDSLYHPSVVDDESIEMSVVRYEFDRTQYINEIQSKFSWLKVHPNRNSLGPHGFNPNFLDEDFPDTSVRQTPFTSGATIVFGYTKEYHQPWVWVEENSKLYPRQLLPAGSMWAKFGCWSLMWDSQHFDLGQSIYRKDSANYVLRSDVTIDECNQEIESLAREVQLYWGATAGVLWEKLDVSGSGIKQRIFVE